MLWDRIDVLAYLRTYTYSHSLTLTHTYSLTHSLTSVLTSLHVQDEVYDQSIDMWGLGHILYMCLTGKHAFDDSMDTYSLTSLCKSHEPLTLTLSPSSSPSPGTSMPSMAHSLPIATTPPPPRHRELSGVEMCSGTAT
jgi:serine/threonine protein kinase